MRMRPARLLVSLLLIAAAPTPRDRAVLMSLPTLISQAAVEVVTAE